MTPAISYTFPVGSNEIAITIYGGHLSPEDCDALSAYVALFKEQALRGLEPSKVATEQDKNTP